MNIPFSEDIISKSSITISLSFISIALPEVPLIIVEVPFPFSVTSSLISIFS